MKDPVKLVMNEMGYNRSQQDSIFHEFKSKRSLWKEVKEMDSRVLKSFLSDLSNEIENRNKK